MRPQNMEPTESNPRTIPRLRLPQSAYSLEQAFKGAPQSDKINCLGLANDPERSRRYKLIGDFIDRNDGRNPKVPDIDEMVPLPLAPLPAWDGAFEWDKEQAAAKLPGKPSDELINRLAKEKHVDPATGLPLPGFTLNGCLPAH